MKLVAVVNSSAELGGAELSLLPVVRNLSETHHVVVFLPSGGPLEKRLLEVGARVVSGFSLPGPLALASRQYGVGGLLPLALAASVQQVRFLPALARLRPTAVYCNGFRAQLGATLPAALLRVPVVWHVRDFVPAGAVGRVWSRLAHHVDVVVANSSATARQVALPPGRARVVHNGIDLTQFRPRETKPSGPPLIGMAGHLTPWKGHLRFIRVLAAVRERVPELRGAIAGGPIYTTSTHREYPARVAAYAREFGLENALEVANVEPDAVGKFLARLSVFVHCPDRPEPFGRALVEAMAVGVPIVAAAGGGTPEVLGRAGIVCPLGDEGAIREGILRLFSNPELRNQLTDAGIERAQKLFDESDYAQHVVAIIRVAAKG